MTPQAEAARPSRRRRWIGTAVLIGSVAAGGAAAWRSGAAPFGTVAEGRATEAIAQEETARGVRVVVAQAAPTIERKRFTGVIVARYEAPLAFRVAGRIAAREVELSDRVAAGQPLLSLDASDYRAATRAAEADLAAAEAQARQAGADEARQARLLAQGWVAPARYDLARAAAEAASAAVGAAREALTLARNQEDYATLAAPYDGIVTSLTAEAGQVVAAGQPVLALARPGAREAEVPIPEGQVADLAEWSARVTLWGQDGAGHPATLREVAPQADRVGRTHAARFAWSADAPVDLGATATVLLTRVSRAPAVELPSSALFFRDGRPTVWVVARAGDRAAAQAVEVVRLGAETASVRGVEDGARVITLGVHRIDEALPIRVIEEAPARRLEARP